VKMRKLVNWFDTMKIVTKCKVNEFFTSEEGDVNVVSLVVLIGVAVVLAIVFKDSIKSLLESLLETITGKATDAVSD